MINYLVDAISQLIETNGEIAKPVIYNTQQSKYNFEILQNDYEFLPKQKAPNCVVEGYRRGMWYRLFGKYSTKEDALYHWLLRKSEEYAAVSHDVKDDGAKQKQLRERDRRDNEKLKERINNLAIIQKTRQHSDSISSGTVRDTKTIYHNSPPATAQDTQSPMQELSVLNAHADGKDSKAEITNTLSASGLATVISAAGVAAQQAGLFASTAQPNTNRRMVFGSAVASGEGATATTINRLTEDPSSKGKETFLTPAVVSQMTQDDRKSNQHALTLVSPMQMATATAPGATAAVFNIDKFIMQSPATIAAEPDIKMQQTINRYHVSSITSEEKSFFVEKIKTGWHENNKEHQADLALYIASAATERMDDEKSFDLEKDVHTFLKSKSRVMLLLGSSGLGKTLFGYYLEQQLWKTYQPELSFSSQSIPLFISLARLKHPNTEAVEETLKAIGFEEKNFPSLKKLPFLFILDGADEVNVRSNLYISNKLDTWPNAKVIFTCRLEYLMQPVCEYRHWFQPSSHRIKRTISETVVERFMAPFSLIQIENYLKKYIEQNKENLSENWRDWKQYWHYFNEIPGLLKLIESPYLLYIASSVLPDLVKQQNLDAKSQDKQEITRLSLYDAFVKHYFHRHIERPKQHESSHLFKDTQSNIEETLLEYNQQIALKLHERDLVSIAFQPEKVKTSSHTRLLTVPSAVNPWVEFFGPGSEIQSKLLASPIKKTGDNHYAFLHPSLRDYFIARELFDQLVVIMQSLQPVSIASMDSKQIESGIAVETFSEEKMTQQILQATPHFAKLTFNIKDKLLRYERQILDFMVERLAREPKHKAVLWAIVEHSKQDATVAKAAANAITILNAAGVSFASRDLRNINIPGADLSSGILDNTQLQGANMTQVNLQGAWLREANLSGAQLKDINFGELPLLLLKDRCNSIQYSPNGLWLAVASGQEIIVYNAQNRESIQTLTGHKGYVLSVAWDHESKHLASGSDDNTVRLWEASSGKALRVLQGHTYSVSSVAWDRESKHLASGSHDKTVRLWEASSGKALRVLQGHTGWVNSIAWDHESKYLASGSNDKTVRIWKVATGNLLGYLQFPYAVTHCAWATSTPGQERLAVAFGNGIACFTLSIGYNSFKAELNWLAIPGIPLHASQINITDAIGLSASDQLLLKQHNRIGKPSVMTNTAFIDSKDAKDSKQAVTASQSTSTATAATGTAASSAGNNAHALFAKVTPKPPLPPKPPISPKPQFLSNTGAKK